MLPIVPSSTKKAKLLFVVATTVVSSVKVLYDREMTRFVAVTVPPEAVPSMVLRTSRDRLVSIRLLSCSDVVVIVEEAVHDSRRLTEGRDAICNNPTIRCSMFKFCAVSLRIICCIASSTFPSRSNEKTLSYECDNGNGVLLIRVVTFVMNKVVWAGVVNGKVVTGTVVSILTLAVVMFALEVVKVGSDEVVSILASEVANGTVFAGIVVSMLTLEVVKLA